MSLLVLVVLGGCYGGFSSLPPGEGGGPGADGDGPRVDLAGDEPGSSRDPDGSSNGGGGGAGLCDACAVQSDCGGGGACVRNSGTGERFCTEPCARGSCASGSSCRDLGGRLALKREPDGDTCRGDPGEEDPDPGNVDPLEPDTGGGLLPEMSDDERELLDLMNRDRASSGRDCGDLEWNEGAARVAQRWSEHMAQSGMYHNPNFYEEIAAEGVQLTTAGENIAWAGSVVEAEDMFMSEGPGGGHYEAILSCDYDAVGLGVAQDGNGMVMVVQDFVGFGGGGGW